MQTAWGRTGGKWFGIEQYGVTPDVITSAKGLGNGLPIGLTVATPEVADSVRGATISTFGENPVTTTAAKAVIDLAMPSASHRRSISGNPMWMNSHVCWDVSLGKCYERHTSNP